MLTTTPKNPKLLAQHQAYVERAKAGGAKFVTYNCPHCDKMHFKITRYRTIEALVPPAETGL